MRSEQIKKILKKTLCKLLSKICRKFLKNVYEILEYFEEILRKFLRNNRKTVVNDVWIKILNQIKINNKEILKNQKTIWEITEIILKSFEEMKRKF